MKPLFSIGVTTYNRQEMLKKCLFSILGQTFSDFEVIVGNDYTREKLSKESLGIHDSRIQFVNHSQNLGEMSNMNALLEMSRGKYFTWLADDDMYAPDFLEAAHSALVRFGSPSCVFTSFVHKDTFVNQVAGFKGKIQIFEGREFLRRYLSLKLKTIGCYALFDAEYLKNIGGMEQLGDGFSPYSDNLLAVKAGLLKTVVYIDASLIFVLAHDQSISYISPDVDAYSSAQADFLSRSVELLNGDGLKNDFHFNLCMLLHRCVSDYYGVMRRSGSLQCGKLLKHSLFIWQYTKLAGGYRYRILLDIIHRAAKLPAQLIRDRLKKRICMNVSNTPIHVTGRLSHSK